MNQLGNLDHSGERNICEGIVPPVSFYSRFSLFLGGSTRGGDIGNETEEPRAPPRLARTLPLTHDTTLIGTFVPAPSTYVPFFSWRKGLTLCPNGTSGGGAVHSFAPQLRLGCGAFFFAVSTHPDLDPELEEINVI